MGLSSDRLATQEAIEFFGNAWIGEFKQDWKPAFESLQQKGILEYTGSEYRFTSAGQQLQKQLAHIEPFARYEYDQYFSMEGKSKAHQAFCQRVYGAPLSQHGLVDIHELSLLQKALESHKPQSILEIGCGNGRLSESLYDSYPTHYVAIDISPEAIRIAQERAQSKPQLHFQLGNMNALTFEEASFDAILSLDTFYYAADLPSLVPNLLRILKPKGHLFVYFSHWIMSTKEADELAGNKTRLAQILNPLNCSYTYQSLTDSSLNHWKRKLTVLEEMKEEFIAEGQFELWDYRYREANRYANWGDDLYSRYFYSISKE